MFRLLSEHKQQRWASAHDTESDDDDFRDAAVSAGSAAKKPPALAQVPPKRGAKRRSKEKHDTHGSDDGLRLRPAPAHVMGGEGCA